MVLNRIRKTLSIALSVPLLLVGCSPKGAPANVASPPSSSKKDGTVISMTLVHVTGENSNIKIYKMFYWSDGKKVEALLSEPKDVGSARYPLLVMCHGGYTSPQPLSEHVTTWGTPATLAQAPTNEVFLAPEYRGYAESQGTVDGLYADATDTENAIKAAETLSFVSNQPMELLGISMGGGVVMKVASDSKYSRQIRAVVAVSPFVGWNAIEEWAQKNEKSSTMAKKWVQAAINSGYGKFEPDKKVYTQNSIDPSKIGAPVLLLQGTADKDVPWQSVQTFYQELKKDGKTAQLKLFQGGNHGLTGKYHVAAGKAAHVWFNKF